MGFLTEDELSSLRIQRMNFQVVGESTFESRAAMSTVEHADFFLERILDVDVGAVFEFEAQSHARGLIQNIVQGATRFSNGACALAADFHSRHVGQAKAGAFFFFELRCSAPHVRLYAMLKYDYSEVLTLRRSSASEQLRRVVQAFVKDKRSLQKSALIRVENGEIEGAVSVRDRAAKSPNITDFFASFLGVGRTRDDVELNREALQAINEVVKQAPKGAWPNGNAQASRAMRQSLKDCAQITEEVAYQAALLAAGRPNDEVLMESLRLLTGRIWRRRRLLGLAFTPDQEVFRVAPSRHIRTVERIRLTFPDELTDVRVVTELNEDGSAVITIRTAEIESNEIVNESLGHVRQLVD